MKRVLAGFVAVIGIAPACLLAYGDGHAAEVAATTATITATAALLFGVPLFIVFRRYGWWQFWQYLIGGAVAGALYAPMTASTLPLGFVAGFLAIGGSVHAALFWAVAIWGNDKLTCPKQFRLPCGTAYRYAPAFIGTRPSLAPLWTGRCWRHPHPS